MKWYEKQKKLFEQNNSSKDEDVKEKNMLDLKIDDSDEYVEFASQEKNDTLLDSMVEEIIVEPIVVVEEPVKKSFTTARTSVLQEGIVINGTVTCDHNLTIFGTINGDIICEGKIIIYGSVKGNLDCNSLEIESAHLVGDVTCKDEVLIQENSVLNGNVSSSSFIHKGHLSGDATVSNCSTFTASSIMVGNLETNEIEITKGSVINGIIRITKDITM